MILPSAYFDLAEELYPFTMYYINHLTGQIFETEIVNGPGVVHIKGGYDFPVGVRMVTPLGTHYGAPPGFEGEDGPRHTPLEVPDA